MCEVPTWASEATDGLGLRLGQREGLLSAPNTHQARIIWGSEKGAAKGVRVSRASEGGRGDDRGRRSK